MPTSTTYPDFTTGIVSLTNFSVTETDIGSVFSFIGTPPAITAQVDGYGAATAQFSSFEYGAARPGSSQLVTMSYHASTTAPGALINSIDASMVVDRNTGRFANTTNTLTAPTIIWGGTLTRATSSATAMPVSKVAHDARPKSGLRVKAGMASQKADITSPTLKHAPAHMSWTPSPPIHVKIPAATSSTRPIAPTIVRLMVTGC